MSLKEANTHIYNVTEKSDVLAIVKEIKNQSKTNFNFVLHGENLEWIVSAFIILKNNFPNTKVMYSVVNTSNIELLENLEKLGMDEIIFSDNALQLDNKKPYILENKSKLSYTDAIYLKELRKQIDDIDFELMKTVIKRFNLVKEIAVIKDKYKIPIFQPERFKEIQKTSSSFAKLSGMETRYLLSIIETIHLNSILSQIQEK